MLPLSKFCLRCLLEQGEPILLKAAQKRSPELVKLLMQHGANRYAIVVSLFDLLLHLIHWRQHITHAQPRHRHADALWHTSTHTYTHPPTHLTYRHANYAFVAFTPSCFVFSTGKPLMSLSKRIKRLWKLSMKVCQRELFICLSLLALGTRSVVSCWTLHSTAPHIVPHTLSTRMLTLTPSPVSTRWVSHTRNPHGR